MAYGPLHRHCRKRGCTCPHQLCDRGWVDSADPTHEAVRPCLTCREDLAVAVLPAQTREDLRQALADRRGDKVLAHV